MSARSWYGLAQFRAIGKTPPQVKPSQALSLTLTHAFSHDACFINSRLHHWPRGIIHHESLSCTPVTTDSTLERAFGPDGTRTLIRCRVSLS